MEESSLVSSNFQIGNLRIYRISVPTSQSKLNMAARAKLQVVPSSEDSAAVLVQREAVINEFGELKRQEAAFAPKKSRIEQLRTVILGWIPSDHPADQPVFFSSDLYEIQISMRAEERVVEQPWRLLKQIGANQFWSLCRVGVKALEEAIGAAKADAWFTRMRTGPRVVTAVPKSSPAVQEAA